VVIAALLIGVIIIGAAAIYQQQQIGSLNHSLSSEQAGSVLINGTSYWQLSIQLQSLNLPTTVRFIGVTFNLTAPQLSGGGTVFVSGVVLSTIQPSLQNLTGIPLTLRIGSLPNILVRFADGQTESHSFVNSADFQAQGSTISINFQPTVSLWFTQHSSPRAGAYLNSATNSLELYVSMGT
jgi:hypothetical protein